MASNRPEHVKCENCAFWCPTMDRDGWCQRFPPTGYDNDGDDVGFGVWSALTAGDDFCGEFRSTWPPEVR